MRGGYGDNYYLQMVEYIRRFKGTQSDVPTDNAATIDIDGGFGQWDYIRAYYKDYEGDTADRNQESYGGSRMSIRPDATILRRQRSQR